MECAARRDVARDLGGGTSALAAVSERDPMTDPALTDLLAPTRG